MPERNQRAGMITRRQWLASGIAAISAAACGGTRPRRIAVIPKTTAIDYWENLHAGATASAKRHNLGLFWNGPQSESDYAQQAQMLEDVIRQRVDGIVLAPSHGSVLASSILHARGEKIPLVLVDSPASVNEADYLAFIGSDAEEMGAVLARRVGRQLGGRGEIAILGVSPTVEAAVQRERRFAAVIASSFPEIRVAEVRYGLADVMRSREMTAEILSSRPNLAAIFASDHFAARGALAALVAHPGRKVKMFGVAQERDLLAAVGRQEIDSLLVQDCYSMGQRAVEILAQAIAAGYAGPRRIRTRMVLATAKNVASDEVQSLLTRHGGA